VLALPLFLVFGQNRFADYVAARRAALAEFRPAQQRMQAALARRGLLTATRYTRDVPFERLAKLPFACRAPMSAHCAPAAWKCTPSTRSVAGPAGCTLPFESAQVPSSTRCTNATAIAPSPTAAAQRRTALWRTSPAANTPGMLVSR